MDTETPPTLADEWLHSACTLARGKLLWTPGPSWGTETLPWLAGWLAGWDARALTLHARLFSHIDATGDCWEWTASTNHRGYGKFWVAGRCLQAHRAVWAVLVGTDITGLVLDHRCHNRACVNPDHLEPVTQSVNVLRARRARRRHLQVAA